MHDHGGCGATRVRRRKFGGDPANPAIHGCHRRPGEADRILRAAGSGAERPEELEIGVRHRMAGAPNVWIVSSGLDHARRGFELSARECFEALVGERGVQLELVKGSGNQGSHERVARTLRRDRTFARALGRARGVQPYRVEALAFAFSLLPQLMRRHPDLVYVSEWDTARGLARLRSLTGHRFKLLLSNGGFVSTGFDLVDHVQELTPAGWQYVVDRGADPETHT